MKKLLIPALALAFFAGTAQAQTTAPMTKDSSKTGEKNAPQGKDRQAMPKTKSKQPTTGAPMPKENMK